MSSSIVEAPGRRRLRHVGFFVDGLLVAACVALCAKRLPSTQVWAVGLPAAIAALPSQYNATSTGAGAIVLSAAAWAAGAPASAPPTASALRAAAWAEYILGDDLGADVASRREADYFRKSNVWKNSLLLPPAVLSVLPHTLAIWARNILAGWLLYFGVGLAWAAWIYGVRGAACFPGGPSTMPSWPDMLAQMDVSGRAMVLYTLAPTVGEWAIERGWTLAYNDPAAAAAWLGLPATAGLAAAAGLLCFYFLVVEWAIYWIHRYLHDNRFLYRLLHRTHHIYNNENTLSPFAGLAFNPVDGLCQAAPYGLLLPILPVHFWAYEALLFFTAVWTTNIHDTLFVESDPVMGSRYHTIHHTTYRDNYGQVFILFDWLHDTLTMEFPEAMRNPAAAFSKAAPAATVDAAPAPAPALSSGPVRRRR